MRKVAIVKINTDIGDYADIESLYLLSHDWEELDESEYYKLMEFVKWSNKHTRDRTYVVIEQYTTQNDEVVRDVKTYIEYQIKQKEVVRKQQEEKLEKARERALKKLAKTEEEEKELLQQLQAKYSGIDKK